MERMMKVQDVLLKALKEIPCAKETIVDMPIGTGHFELPPHEPNGTGIPRGERETVMFPEKKEGLTILRQRWEQGVRMNCGWGCGTQLTVSQMQAHFAGCLERPRA
jgi:hypothetical protein